MNHQTPFKFQAKTKFIAGPHSIKQLGAEVNRLGVSRLLLVTDQGIVKAGLLEAVTTPLESAGISVTLFDQVESNPTNHTADAGAQQARHASAEAVLGVGGGSPIDAAKLIAVMATNDGPIETYCGAGVDPWPEQPLPIIAVPTTAGTGAEVSAAGMINLPDLGRKMDIFGPSILPQVAIADAALTVGLPPKLTAWTGVDALSHAIEAYTCRGATPISDALAEGAIKLAADNLRTAYQAGNNIEARHNMLVASAMAVMAASGAGGLGVIHSLAQTLGGFYNLPHGLTIAVCFTLGLRFNLEMMPHKYATVAHLLGVNTNGMTTEQAAQTVISAIEQLLVDIDIADTFETLTVQPDDIPQLAKYALLDGCTPTNPRPLNEEDFVALFQQGFVTDL